MFNSISGILAQKNEETIYVEQQGIEWECFVSALSIDRFGTVGDSVKVYTWLYHREDQMRLFGFISPQERTLFFDLIKVDGVGPKQALKILSGLDYTMLEAVLDQGDIVRLQAIPGIGKKTAQKMVLALKGHLTDSVSSTQKKQSRSAEFEDIIVALTDMGFDRKRAAEVIEDIVAELRSKGVNPAQKEQDVLKAAIVRMSAGY